MQRRRHSRHPLAEKRRAERSPPRSRRRDRRRPPRTPPARTELVTVLPFLLAVALQQPQTQPDARLVVRPANAEIAVGDSVQLIAEVRDASGSVVPNARVVFRPGGGSFEGRVDSTGLVVGGATTTIPVTVIGLIEGQRPILQQAFVRVVPGPAARIDLSNAPRRLVVGQAVPIRARIYSALGDERRDRPMWRSSAPAIVHVDGDGMITAVAPGRATVIASVGDVRASAALEVSTARVASVRVTASAREAREGDVVQFTAS